MLTAQINKQITNIWNHFRHKHTAKSQQYLRSERNHWAEQQYNYKSVTMFEEVLPGDVVLVLWTDIGEATEQFQQVVHQLQAGVGGYSTGVIWIWEEISPSGLIWTVVFRTWWEGVCGEHGAALHGGLLPLHLQPRLLGLRGPGQRPAHRGHSRQPHQPPQTRGPAHLPAGALTRAAN